MKVRGGLPASLQASSSRNATLSLLSQRGVSIERKVTSGEINAHHKVPFLWNVDKHREIMSKVSSKLGVAQLDDWHTISRKEVVENGGRRIFNCYRSLQEALQTIYPDYPWDEEKFERQKVQRRKGLWGDKLYQQNQIERIGKELGIQQLDEWYTVPREEVIAKGGGSLFRHYHNIGEALQTIYPNHAWKPSKFVGGAATRLFWRDEENLENRLAQAEQQLDIKKPEDWYSVSLTDLKDLGFPTKFSRTALSEALQRRYPSYNWDKIQLLRGRLAQQRRLEKEVNTLFPDVTIISNARKEADLINPQTGDYLELDIYIPELKLAFEYQDVYHYKSVGYGYQPVDIVKMRDKVKHDLASAKGITLILVPYWWDGKQDSLVATIKTARSDLLPNVNMTTKPIPETLPQELIEKQSAVTSIEDIGEPSTACFFTRMNIDPTNWWIFEKYDGVRGFWNPLKKAFYSRHGNRLPIPQEIVDNMPGDTFLDGELWYGRENFQESLKLSNRLDPSAIDWKRFKYMVFDIPNHPGTYAERYKELEAKFSDKKETESNNSTNNNVHISVAPKIVCKGTQHFEEVFQDYIDKGAEGVILRDPTRLYEPGRSKGYLKHKKFRDAEAMILNQTGPFKWECQLPNGVTFVAVPGTTEFTKRYSPKPGDIVSFKHRGFLLGTKKPKAPILFRLRPDLTWEHVCKNWNEKKSNTTVTPFKRPLSVHKPKGYWKNKENRRKYFTELAQKLGFDPMDANKWNQVTLPQFKGGTGMLKTFKTFKNALQSTFPDLNFDFKESKPPHYWLNVQHCRGLFDEFAREKGLNPLNADDWYSVDLKELLSKRGGTTIQAQHGGLRKALQKAYPELRFERWIQAKILLKAAEMDSQHTKAHT